MIIVEALPPSRKDARIFYLCDLAFRYWLNTWFKLASWILWFKSCLHRPCC